MDFGSKQPVAPLAFSVFNAAYGPGSDLNGYTTPVLASMTWVANLALYVPIAIPFQFLLSRFWWVNGSSVAANVDVGVYTPSGARLASTGSTAQSGASVLQYAAPSGGAILLSPGQYYLAWAGSGTTNAVFGTTAETAIALRIAGCLQQATALPLPASMTAAAVSNAVLPLCGITQAASGF